MSDQYVAPGSAPPQNGLGTAAMVLGIVGLVLVITVIGGFICGLLAVIFGFIGASRAKRGIATNRGHAITGVVTGIVAILASVVALYFYLPRGYHHNCALGNQPRSCIQK
ncbi:MAG: hypothetical protein QOG34_774 [Frankiaceae bacterium]|jgi:uncharacterized BrkB/YihY/UPF0761 family membrane protein|nr:hypothetical protein [Frankiaceae bacterium]